MVEQSRREFLKAAALGLSVLAAEPLLSSCAPRNTPTVPPTQPIETKTEEVKTADPTQTQAPQDYPHLVVTRNGEPEAMVRKGIEALGGMGRFMKTGADVIIKPNICVGYHSYEYAATTNPWVVGTLVKLCLEAGAKRVRVMDFPFGGPAETCYKVSGIAEQVEAAGGEMEVMSQMKYTQVEIPDAVSLKKVTVYQDILKTDFLIDVPIAKNHGMATLTLGLKNLMGVMLNRESIHPSFEKNLVDLATLVKPHLTVIDAVRTLMANGPTGGDLNDVKKQNTVIFSPDVVAADAFATRLFDMKPEQIPYILSAAQRGLGIADLSQVTIQEIDLNA